MGDVFNAQISWYLLISLFSTAAFVVAALFL